MALALNHYSIRTTNLDACRDFYEKVLGLTVGPRPEFPFPGLWMYCGDHGQFANAVVHIIGTDRAAPAGLDQYLGAREEKSLAGTGVIDHVAFFADGLAAMLAHLQKLGISCRQRLVPGLGLYQLFLDDPDGVVIELNYPAHEKAALDASLHGA